jgi:membrane protease subunit (stomatin/prohibitin family)
MATRIFDAETWRKLGQPDLNSKMYYINKSTGKKVWGTVIAVNYGHKRGVQLRIKPFNK